MSGGYNVDYFIRNLVYSEKNELLVPDAQQSIWCPVTYIKLNHKSKYNHLRIYIYIYMICKV